MSLARLNICADLINKKYDKYTLLDVGCRTKDLKPLLKNCVNYSGTDQVAGEHIHQCDLEQGLPFNDDEFDIVTALDVLEHLDNPHEILYELYRVAKKAVFISLPNMYYIIFRINFLFGRGISGKYTFLPEPVLDRHRWLLSYDEALKFIDQNSSNYQVTPHMILPVRGKTKLIAEPIEKYLANTWPNLFVYGILFDIKMEK